ncbi:MAG: hypothetical protein QOJ84_3800 [Bradyrhizobium sp.]|nr:hypothetical protein [Bradyrhizobium sp.]
MAGSDQSFSELWNNIQAIWRGLVEIWWLVYPVNTVAFALMAFIVLVGICSLAYVRHGVMSTAWLSRLPADRQKYYGQLRNHLTSMNIWTLGSFLIASLIFVLASSLSAWASPGSKLSGGQLEAISFLTKGIIVGTVIRRVVRMATALKKTALE